jgi:hypothetical protein
VSPEFATRFVIEWLGAWNAHDIDRILSHYSEDFEMFSPAIARVTGSATGSIRGKQAVGEYWVKALTLHPNLEFVHVCSLIGVDSLVVHYIGVANRRVVEVFNFDSDGLVSRAHAYYEVTAPSEIDRSHS